MKMVIVFAVLMMGGVLGGQGQDQVQTSTLEGARFEIVQSPLDKAATFRLDKFSGTIDRLGTCPKDDGFGSNKCWKEMVVLDLVKSAFVARIRYQIVINVPSKLTMLVQLDSGRTWQLGVDPQDRWAPFIDCTDKANSNCLWRP